MWVLEQFYLSFFVVEFLKNEIKTRKLSVIYIYAGLCIRHERNSSFTIIIIRFGIEPGIYKTITAAVSNNFMIV